MTTYGTAQTVDGWTYTFDEDDLLWLARSLWGEGGERSDAVAWTLFQRYALPQIRENKFSRFAGQIRAYSQPVNPIWALGGDRCPVPDQSDCSPSRLERRELISTARWDDIPAVYRDAAEAFVKGEVRNPVPGAIHFAVHDLVMRFHVARDPGGIILLEDEGNTFWADSTTRRFLPNWVTIEGLGLFREVPWRDLYAQYGRPSTTDAVAKTYRAAGGPQRFGTLLLFAAIGAGAAWVTRRYV